MSAATAEKIGPDPKTAEPEDELDALAAEMVADWPVLSDERKRELGVLLSSAV